MNLTEAIQESTRLTNSIMVPDEVGKNRHLRVYWDRAGHPYVRTGKGARTREYVTDFEVLSRKPLVVKFHTE